LTLSPLIVACLAATWLVWGSTYLAIKFALVSLLPFFQMGTRFLVAGMLLLAWMRLVRKARLPSNRMAQCARDRRVDGSRARSSTAPRR
jgi:drug/metabolite transporter (DMT)-like permease